MKNLSKGKIVRWAEDIKNREKDIKNREQFKFRGMFYGRRGWQEVVYFTPASAPCTLILSVVLTVKGLDIDVEQIQF